MANGRAAASDGSQHWRIFRAFDLLRALHQNFYDQIKTADQKAGYVCTFLTILLAVSKEQGNVLLFLTSPPSWKVSWALSLIFAASACFSVACTAMVILPRTAPGVKSYLFWGSWTGGGIKAGQLLDEKLDDFMMAEYLKDINNLALICRAKYKFVNLAFRGTALTILSYFAILILK